MACNALFSGLPIGPDREISLHSHAESA